MAALLFLLDVLRIDINEVDDAVAVDKLEFSSSVLFVLIQPYLPAYNGRHCLLVFFRKTIDEAFGNAHRVTHCPGAGFFLASVIDVLGLS
jgi:hypothetical protein